MGCKFAPEPGQIESSVDLPHHVIFGNGIAKTKLVEQLTLVTLQTAHHGSTSPRFASPQRNHASRRVSTDFCNKIGQQRKSRSFDQLVPTGEHLSAMVIRAARWGEVDALLNLYDERATLECDCEHV